jgi:hypothetical protein
MKKSVKTDRRNSPVCRLSQRQADKSLCILMKNRLSWRIPGTLHERQSMFDSSKKIEAFARISINSG